MVGVIMDILLIYPSLTVEERYGRRGLSDVGGNLPPLGIAQLASSLESRGFSAGLIDAVVRDMDEKDVLNEIDKIKPYVVGISAVTPIFHRAAALSVLIKEKFPSILIIMGGHHVTIVPEQALEEQPCIDIIGCGEGEETLCEIMEKYRSKNFSREDFLGDYIMLEGIKGIGFRRNDGSVHLTRPREPIEDLDSLPFSARHLLPMEKYLPLPNQYKRRPVINMVFIRGCPFECSFCSNTAIYGRRVRYKSPVRAMEEIEHVVERYGARELSFWDDTFTTNRKWVEELCRRLIESRIGVIWSCYGSVGTVDPDLLKLMKRAGCWNIFYGFESGNQKLLDNISKGITLDEIRKTAKWTHEAGIEIRASFMLALPGETPEMARETLNLALELEPEYVQFSFTTPFPRTRLYDEVQNYGRLNHSFSEYYGWIPVFVPFGYKDREEIMKIHKWMTRRFYFRPKYILRMLKKIRTWEDVNRYIKGLRVAARFALSTP